MPLKTECRRIMGRIKSFLVEVVLLICQPVIKGEIILKTKSAIEIHICDFIKNPINGVWNAKMEYM